MLRVSLVRRRPVVAALTVVLLGVGVFLGARCVLRPQRRDRRVEVLHGMQNEGATGRPISWWLWAAGQMAGLKVPDAGSGEAWDGPVAAVVRAPAEPVDVVLADGGNRADAEDACRAIWLVRHLLPPAGSGENLIVGLRQLGSALTVVRKGRVHLDSLDLGFDVHVESATVGFDSAWCQVQSVSHEGEPYEMRMTCGADASVEAPIGAALGNGFSVLTRRGDWTFWRVHFGRPDAEERAARALAKALGAASRTPRLPSCRLPTSD
jgi:hypothetical protein